MAASVLLLASLMVLALAACGQDVPTATPAAESASPLEPTAEETSDAFTSPIPTPIGELPDPEPGSGHVAGRLISETDDEPIATATIFLGDLLEADGSVSGVGLEPDIAPQAETDAQGRFVFMNAPPGRYGLIWWRSHRESYALSAGEQDEGEFLIVVVEDGHTTDLGDVTVNLP